MAKYNTVLFDADGTLFDFVASESVALTDTLVSAGLEVNESIIKKYKNINYDLWRQIERGKIKKDELKIERFTRLFRSIGHVADPAKYSMEYIQRLGRGIHLIDGAVDICQALYGKCSMHIATNGMGEVQRPRMELSGMRQYFGELFISEEIGYPKPYAEYFDYIFDELGIQDRSDVIIIGDSLTSDMQGGINAGIATCWYNPQKNKNRTKFECKYEISELSQIEDIVL